MDPHAPEHKRSRSSGAGSEEDASGIRGRRQEPRVAEPTCRPDATTAVVDAAAPPRACQGPNTCHPTLAPQVPALSAESQAPPPVHAEDLIRAFRNDLIEALATCHKKVTDHDFEDSTYRGALLDLLLKIRNTVQPPQPELDALVPKLDQLIRKAKDANGAAEGAMEAGLRLDHSAASSPEERFAAQKTAVEAFGNWAMAAKELQAFAMLYGDAIRRNDKTLPVVVDNGTEDRFTLNHKIRDALRPPRTAARFFKTTWKRR